MYSRDFFRAEWKKVINKRISSFQKSKELIYSDFKKNQDIYKIYLHSPVIDILLASELYTKDIYFKKISWTYNEYYYHATVAEIAHMAYCQTLYIYKDGKIYPKTNEGL